MTTGGRRAHSVLAARVVCEVPPEAVEAWLRSGEIRVTLARGKAADGTLVDAETYRQWSRSARARAHRYFSSEQVQETG